MIHLIRNGIACNQQLDPLAVERTDVAANVTCPDCREQLAFYGPGPEFPGPGYARVQTLLGRAFVSEATTLDAVLIPDCSCSAMANNHAQPHGTGCAWHKSP